MRVRGVEERGRREGERERRGCVCGEREGEREREGVEEREREARDKER